MQGNLDPAVLCADWNVVQQHTHDILDQVGHTGKHIFNVGHGILPQTPVDTVARLIDEVQSLCQQIPLIANYPSGLPSSAAASVG
jgi:uroporphyrinogen decarboxylase